MDIERISASSYKDHSHCPMKWFIGQRLKIRYPAGLAASRGTISHRVLEILAEQKLARQAEDRYFSTAETGDVASEKDLDVLKLSRKVFDYQTKEVMPHLDWEEKDFNECYRYVKVALEHGGGKFDPRKRKIISTEQYIKIAPEENWAVLPNGEKLFLTGFIDLVTDEGDNTIEIIDWKTGQQKDFHSGEILNEKTLRKDIQLKLYHYAGTRIYGEDKNFLVTIFFLKTQTPITIMFTPEDLEDTKTQVKNKLSKILDTKIPYRNMSWKCRKFCDYGKNTFAGSEIAPMQQMFEGNVSDIGDNMCICDQVYYNIIHYGLQWTEENMGGKI